MPIGVPRAPFRIPGDEDATWVDLYNRLYRARAAFLGEEIDYEIGNHIMGLMVFYGIEDEEKNIFFFINSPGGLAIPGFGIYDIMHYVEPDVYTLGLGLVASMASLLLAGGEKKKRRGGYNIRVMLHQPASVAKNSKKKEKKKKKPKRKGERFPTTYMDAQNITQIREEAASAYVKITGKDSKIINDDLERNFFMTATEAKEYGLIDDIGFEGIAELLREAALSNPDSPEDRGRAITDHIGEMKRLLGNETDNPSDSDSSDSDEPD